MSGKELRGKVVKLLTSREVVINLGEKDGVKKGMIFAVLDPNGIDIVDPDTGESLGSIERVKVKLKITQVGERISVASTYRKRKVNIGGTGFDFSSMLRSLDAPPQYVYKYETLKTKDKPWEEIKEEDSYVKVGDPVKLLDDENDTEDK